MIKIDETKFAALTELYMNHIAFGDEMSSEAKAEYLELCRIEQINLNEKHHADGMYAPNVAD